MTEWVLGYQKCAKDLVARLLLGECTNIVDMSIIVDEGEKKKGAKGQ